MNIGEKVGEIFREAGNAFYRLCEMTLLLNAMGAAEPYGKWEDLEIEMLRCCIHNFAVNLNNVSQRVKKRTGATQSLIGPQPLPAQSPQTDQLQQSALIAEEALKIPKDESLFFNPELVPEEPPADIMQPDEAVEVWTQENYRIDPPRQDPPALRITPERDLFPLDPPRLDPPARCISPEPELLPLDPHKLTMSVGIYSLNLDVFPPQPVAPPARDPVPPASLGPPAPLAPLDPPAPPAPLAPPAPAPLAPPAPAPLGPPASPAPLAPTDPPALLAPPAHAPLAPPAPAPPAPPAPAPLGPPAPPALLAPPAPPASPAPPSPLPPPAPPAPPIKRAARSSRRLSSDNRMILPTYKLSQLRGDFPSNDGSAYRRESSRHRRVESTTCGTSAHGRTASSNNDQYSSLAGPSTSQFIAPSPKKRSRSSKKKSTPKQDKKKSLQNQDKKKSSQNQDKNKEPKTIMGPPPPPPPLAALRAPIAYDLRNRSQNRVTAKTASSGAGGPIKPDTLP